MLLNQLSDSFRAARDHSSLTDLVSGTASRHLGPAVLCCHTPVVIEVRTTFTHRLGLGVRHVHVHTAEDFTRGWRDVNRLEPGSVCLDRRSQHGWLVHIGEDQQVTTLFSCPAIGVIAAVRRYPE